MAGADRAGPRADAPSGTDRGAHASVTVPTVNADDAGQATPRSADEPQRQAFASFDDLYGATHDEIARALCLAVSHTELGQDAAAEAFTRALHHWDKVSRCANPAGWVYRVGLNWARSRLRKYSRERYFDAEIRTASTPPIDVDPALGDALRQLSPEHRAVVVGRCFLDWSEADVADALEIPPGTVKSRLHRALAQLSTLLEAPDA